ncbi:hypothetical protein [Rhodoflexus caldus]|uniref:hypothetical protein n=1 Tax=Rhodoflexus caldus TaxID=2891236 RepID=UPI00202AAE1A|nr:hypothetical protein [Rhodoflexus caldus]
MEKDKIEKFISQNREAFDSEEPDAKVWASIQKGMQQGKSVRMVPLYRLWQVAASIILLLGTGIGWLVYENRQLQKNAASTFPTNDAVTVTLDQIAPELAEAEDFYTRQIQLKSDELSRYDLKKLGVGKDYETELKKLNEAYGELKNDFYKTGSQRVVEAMIQNLQYRMELLNKQLEILEKVQKQTQQKNEKLS